MSTCVLKHTLIILVCTQFQLFLFNSDNITGIIHYKLVRIHDFMFSWPRKNSLSSFLSRYACCMQRSWKVLKSAHCSCGTAEGFACAYPCLGETARKFWKLWSAALRTLFCNTCIEKHNKITIMSHILKKDMSEKSFHCLPPDFSDFSRVSAPGELVKTRRRTD